MDIVLKHRSSIYGLMALWIVVFHIHGHAGIPFPLANKYVGYLLSLGNTGVDVFMFLSAYCLAYGYKKYDRVSQFYKKRVKRLALPYLIIATPFFIWKNVEIDNAAGIADRFQMFIMDLTGISFINQGMDWTWFIFAILLLYLLFPILYKICSYGIISSCIIFIASYLIIFCVYKYVPESIIHHRFAIAYCRIPVFIVGIITYLYIDTIQKKNMRLAVPFLLSLCVYLILMTMAHYVNHTYNILFEGKEWLVFLPRVIPICYICAWVLNSIKKLPILEMIGDASLEMYLWHILILNVFIYYSLHTTISYWCYLLIPIGGGILAITTRFVINNIVYESSSSRRI